MAAPSDAPDVRLAYLTSQYPATSHTFILREVRALRERGLELATFSVRPPSAAELQDPLLASEARTTWTILAQPASRLILAHLAGLISGPAAYARTFACALGHRPAGLKGLTLSIAHFAEAIALASELRSRGINHLHNHFANSGATVGFLAAQYLGIPWSFTMHGVSETDFPSGITLGRKVAAADAVICASYFIRAQAMRVSDPADWPKMQVVRCGLPVAKAAASPRRENSQPVILCVARLSSEKGLPGLLEAFASVVKTHPDCTLTLVGDGPERVALERQARLLGLGNKIHLAGRQSEDATLALIAKSDMLVVASFMEGLPIVLMEAMAAGTPVIASHIAGIPELVEHGKTGLLFAPSDWPALTSAMICLLDDLELRAALAENALKAVRAAFDVERSAAQLVQIFDRRSLPGSELRVGSPPRS